ncbi:MAG: DUF6118 family protein [Sphingobium sp.]|uniref:DUF6118 family protein n=1 Tax=Sphingobium sp. TaxID=1912891 RepID=UPI0029A8DC2F|nr:DUF6118 family protein [Sphingobium sp.]MDX3908194.1 DUF6118 family protein [Sphingobium sp.]
MNGQQSSMNEAEQETAAQAFARLDGRVAIMARAVEHLAAERASVDIPDYSATLAQMSTRLAAVAQGLASIAEKPAMQLTPEGLAARMDAAAQTSRATDKATLKEAREAHQEAARIIHSLVRMITSAGEQRRHLIWVASGGVVAGCLLWSILPGVILRAMPTSWHMPESMATHIVGEPTLWDAGARLMQAGDPRAWQAIIAAVEMRSDNLDVITKCKNAADKAKRPKRCTIEVRQ